MPREAAARRNRALPVLPRPDDSHRSAFCTPSVACETSSTRPYRLVHLSDPHISRRYYREHIKSLKILLRSILEAGCDHLIVTGDIVSTADPDDFTLAREIFSTFGLLRSDRLTLVPGNHDMFGGPHRAVEVLEYPSRIRRIDHASMRRLFVDTFAETFDDALLLLGDSLFPFVKHAGPYDIIGIDSTMPWSLLRNPFGSNGRVDDPQMEALLALSPLLDPRRIPVVAMHHHLAKAGDTLSDHAVWNVIEDWTMRLWGRKKLARRFASLGVRVILHGHVHCNTVHTLRGMSVANGAGAVCDDPHPFLKYNVVCMKEGGISLETTTLPIPYQTQSLPSLRPRNHRLPSRPQLAAT